MRLQHIDSCKPIVIGMLTLFINACNTNYSIAFSEPSATLRLDTLLDLGITQDEYRKVVYCSDGETILVNLPYQGDSLHFIEINLSTLKKDNFYVNMTGITPGFNMESPEFMDIAMNKNTVVLLAFRGLIVLNRKVGSLQQLRYEYSVSMPVPYSKVGLCGNLALLAYCYNHHPNDAPYKTELSTFDIPHRTLLRRVHPDFSVIQLTHFSPHQWIDFDGQYILFSQGANYRITVYDTSLHVVGILQRTPSDWKPIDSSAITAITQKHPINSVKSALPEIATLIERTSCSVIKNVNFLDSVTIAVGYTPSDPSPKQRFERVYDIWQRSDVKKNEWVCVHKEISTLNKDRTDTCRKENYMNYMQFAKTCLGKQKMVYIISRAPELRCIYDEGVAYPELSRRSETYFSKNQPFRYMLFKYMWGVKL